MRFVSFSFRDISCVMPEFLLDPELNTLPLQPLSKIDEIETPPLNADFDFSKDLQNHLEGKLLLLEEIPFDLDEIHEHYLNGFIQYEKGIDNFICARCGNDKRRLFGAFACFRCKDDECHYCRNCIMMGRISECSILVRWIGPSVEKMAGALEWNGSLTPQQKAASDKIVELVESKGELLVWAVCGAGKTEILFKGIERALQLGLKICIATPRTDVVIELTPRIKQAFPHAEVISLYGGSEDLNKTGNIVLSTTHQLFRYKNAFDLMIIDEVDAFPYSFDKTLEFATKEATNNQATTIYLSATPSEELKDRVETVKISKRFHGHPLPVPEFVWCGNWQKNLKHNRLPKNVRRWVEERIKFGMQAFLFVPTIEAMKEVHELLKNDRVDFVYAEDPDRKEKVQKFRDGEITVLITTTILERGVTVPNIDVAVLGAEHDVFNSSALIQIAGRVGRSAKYPTGNVSFFHYGKSESMMEARRQIQIHNSEGK